MKMRTPLGLRMFVAALVTAVSLASPDVALACVAKIGNFVWLDLNRDGIQDANEPGIAAVQVDLLSEDGTQVLKTVSTDANGFYLFQSTIIKTEDPACFRNYLVRVQTPSGLSPTIVGAGTDVQLDSNNHAGTQVAPTDVRNEDLTIDFGFVPPIVCTASIGNFVWNDANNNGLQDAGEGVFQNVPMTLSGSSSASTMTNANGLYAFTNLCAGTYTVCADTPLGFQPAPTDVSGNTLDTIDNDGSLAGNQSCVQVTLAAGEQNDTIDFGFWKTPTTSPGTGTPGFWKTHPEAWPVDEIAIGGVTFSKEAALAWLGTADGGDKTITMFRALVAAKLNVAIGNQASCIVSTISAADAWMASYGPVGSNIKARTLAWRQGEPLAQELDAYNNGDRCAPHRE